MQAAREALAKKPELAGQAAMLEVQSSELPSKVTVDEESHGKVSGVTFQSDGIYWDGQRQLRWASVKEISTNKNFSVFGAVIMRTSIVVRGVLITQNISGSNRCNHR